MARTPGACLICGKPLQYFPREREMTCSLCGQTFPSRASCEDGHFVCDSCHARRGVEVILDYCRRSALRDPIRMAQEMMDDPFLYMHGNEHHILVGAALLTAYRNAGGELELEPALEEMRRRGGAYPGGSCGFWGCCPRGAAVVVLAEQFPSRRGVPDSRNVPGPVPGYGWGSLDSGLYPRIADSGGGRWRRRPRARPVCRSCCRSSQAGRPSRFDDLSLAPRHRLRPVFVSGWSLPGSVVRFRSRAFSPCAHPACR